MCVCSFLLLPGHQLVDTIAPLRLITLYFLSIWLSIRKPAWTEKIKKRQFAEKIIWRVVVESLFPKYYPIWNSPSPSPSTSIRNWTSRRYASTNDPVLPHPTWQTFSFLVWRALQTYYILFMFPYLHAWIVQWLVWWYQCDDIMFCSRVRIFIWVIFSPLSVRMNPSQFTLDRM